MYIGRLLTLMSKSLHISSTLNILYIINYTHKTTVKLSSYRPEQAFGVPGD